MNSLHSEHPTSSKREVLAAIQHEIWAHWMSYLFTQCTHLPDGSYVIPEYLVTHWKRQVATIYNDLSEREKESDRHQADKILKGMYDD